MSSLYRLAVITICNVVFWYFIGRSIKSRSSCSDSIIYGNNLLDYVNADPDNNCNLFVSEKIPKFRPLLTEGFMRYKSSILVDFPYPQWSILMQQQSGLGSKCDIIVNPHVAQRKLYQCLAVVAVNSNFTYNLLHMEPPEKPKKKKGDEASDKQSTKRVSRGRNKRSFTSSSSSDSVPVLTNVTGFFDKVASDVGRMKLAENMVSLLSHLSSLEIAISNRLHERSLLPGDDVVVMVVNAGEMDLFANFACSCRVNNISMRNVVVFSGSEDILPLLESLGAIGLYDNDAFARVSRNASFEYLDNIFIDMMWYKSFSVWLLLKMRYNVLFQDVDLVWYRDPVSYFHTASKTQHADGGAAAASKMMMNGEGDGRMPLDYSLRSSSAVDVVRQVDADSWGNSLNYLPPADAYLSDDGQRSLRYTPFFANSGFYYLVANERTEYFAWSILTAFDLLHITGSHQNVFTIRLIESLDLAGLNPKLLSLREFPAGIKLHHDKPYMRAIRDKHEHPFIFHM